MSLTVPGDQAGLRVLLLGPTELRADDGEPRHIGGLRRRALLAALAVHLNRPVAVERLADIVWDGEPPRHARPALQGHVAALRRLLPAGLVLETHDSAYRLAGRPELVDCHRFESLAEHAPSCEAALGLWRGAALADLTAGRFFAAYAERLQEGRLRALSAWAGAELERGTGGRVTPLLRAAVRDHPLDETIASALIRCLCQDGRTAEAIEAYHRTRALLAAELGVRPGPELRAAFAEALRAGPAERPAPHRLPPRPGVFVGREEQCAWLDATCAGDSPLAVVTGPAGVGKTTLVLRWAHAAAGRFPDGVLFADLHGFDDVEPADPAVALAGFLLALGVPEREIPRGTAERTDLFRALTRQRRMLVVLDNALDAAAVRRLLPDGERCATVVTSRNAMLDLAVTDAGALRALPPFSSAEARALLDECVGTERVGDEPAAAARLAGLCDNLPLALRICAARLAVRPGRRLADLAGELTEERTRLEEIDRGGDGFTAALNLTWRRLPDTARRLVPLLGLHPGAEINSYAAAALLGSPLPVAREALDRLAAWHVVTEPRPGRFTRQDLVVLHCRRLAAENLDARESAEALGRLLDYYLEATARAALKVPVYRGLVSHPARPPSGGAPEPADGAAALAWFRHAEPVVRAIASEGLRARRYAEVWRLSENVQALYYHAPSLTRWPELAAVAHEAAVAARDPAATTRTTCGLGTALAECGRPRAGVRHLGRAVALAETAGDPLLVVNTQVRLGLGLLKLGDAPRAAYEAFARALRVAETMEEVEIRAVLHHHAGRALREAGDLPGALAQVDASLRLTAGLTADNRTFPLFTRARVLWSLGRAEEAAESARAALRLLTGYRRPGEEAECRELLAAVLRELGEPEAARAEAERAARLRVAS